MGGTVESYHAFLDDQETITLLRSGRGRAPPAGPPTNTITMPSSSTSGRPGDTMDTTLDELKRNLNSGISHAERCIDQQKIEYEREVRQMEQDRANLRSERDKLVQRQLQLSQKEAQLTRDLEEVDRLRAAVELASAKKKGFLCC